MFYWKIDWRVGRRSFATVWDVSWWISVKLQMQCDHMHHDRMLIPGVTGVFVSSPYLVVTWLLHLFQSLSSANPDLSCLGTAGEGISSRWSTLSWDIPSDLLSSPTPDFPGTTPLDCDSRPSSGAYTPNTSIIDLWCFVKTSSQCLCVDTWTCSKGVWNISRRGASPKLFLFTKNELSD